MSIVLDITPKEIDFCGNGLAFRVQGTQYIPEMDDFKIKAEIHLVASDGSTELINTLEMDVDSSGRSEFKIGRILKDYIDTVLPTMGVLGWTETPILKYTVAIREESEHPSFSTIAPELFTAYALKGKVDFLEYPGFDFVQDISNNKPFLNSDGEIEMWESKNYFLYLYNPHTSTEVVQYNVKIFYTDLTTHETTVNILNFDPTIKTIFGTPCSMDVLGLNSFNPDKEIYRYDLEMFHADDSQLCQKKTFRVIDRPMFVREFCFMNKFGVPEFFHTSSKSTTKLIIKKDVSKKELPIGYTASDKQYTEKLESAHNEIENTSGAIPAEQALAFQNALVSEGFWELVNGLYIPCIIKDGSFDIIQDSEDISTIKFSYRRAFDR